MTMALGLMLNEGSASAATSSFAEAMSNVLKLAGVVSLAYVIVVGVAFRAGGALGKGMEKRYREAKGLPTLKFLADTTETPLFWKDPAIVQGGLRGLVVMGILSAYVVLMLAYARPVVAMLAETIAILLGFPNAMAGMFIVMMSLVFVFRGGKKIPLLSVLVASVLAAVGTVAIIVHYMGQTTDGRAFLGVQFLFFTVQSLCISYLMGVPEGASSVRFEERLTLVEVLTNGGETISDLRLLKTHDSDCRFVDTDGTEMLIPKEQIKWVKAKGAAKS